MMMKNNEKDIVRDLLIDLKSIKIDTEGGGGNLAIAKANQIAEMINLIGNHQNIFPKDVQNKVSRFVIAYKNAQDENSPDDLTAIKLIEPTEKCIIDYLKKRHEELNK